MRRSSSFLGWWSVAVVVLVVLGTAVACAPASPEERVAQIRSLYKAKLNGFLVQEEPLVPLEAPPEGEEGVEAPARAEGAEAELPAEPVPVRQKVLLDIMLQHDSPERLPGVTVDISMVDGNQQPKGEWRAWFETADIPKANQRVFTYVLEDVDYREGDGFAVEVRHPVPPEERGDYQEFAVSP